MVKLSDFGPLKDYRTHKFQGDGLSAILLKRHKVLVLEHKINEAEEIQLKANSIYIIGEGELFLSCIGIDGKKIIIDHLREGSIFGDFDFDGLDEYEDGFLFIEPILKRKATVYVFDKRDFLEGFLENPYLTAQIFSNFSHQFVSLVEKIEALTFLNLKTRLIYELVRLGEPDSENSDMIRINFKITHEKLAQSAGAVRETVSKALADLKKEGLIFYDSNKNLIVNIQKISQSVKSILLL